MTDSSNLTSLLGNHSLFTVIDVLPSTIEAEREHSYSLAIFFILIVIVLSILLVHVLLITKFRYIPDSLTMIFLGSVIGAVLNFTGSDWRNEEALSPNAFFLLLLPPIIFESGYNLHKGNFFANIFSILVFAVFGTLISAVVIGSCIYFLGQAQLIYSMNGVESFAFGSLISAVDPVATLAIFQAIKVDQILYMLVFGESMLNDAVSVVLTSALLSLNSVATTESLDLLDALLFLLRSFLAMFFGSALVGTSSGLLSALLLKHVNLQSTPSLEFGLMLVFAYLPYSLTEGLRLSGIMAILFCGITMSHYTHYNLSAITQVTVQQTFRSLAFIAEACVFAYLGMAPFTFPMIFKPAFISWTIVLCLLSRAFNVFPLSFLVNSFREHKITRKMQFLLWFSGLRGAIAFALSLHTSFADEKTRRIVVSTTYCVVLFTIVVFGGSTLPLITHLNRKSSPKTKRNRRRRRKSVQQKRKFEFSLSKTIEMGSTVDSFSELTDHESVHRSESSLGKKLRGLASFDAVYLKPIFVRKFTCQEKVDNRTRLTNLASRWYDEVQQDGDSDVDAAGDGGDLLKKSGSASALLCGAETSLHSDESSTAIVVPQSATILDIASS